MWLWLLVSVLFVETKRATGEAQLGFHVLGAHDLRQWSQLISKGARSFTVDLHFTRPHDCHRLLVVRTSTPAPSSFLFIHLDIFILLLRGVL